MNELELAMSINSTEPLNRFRVQNEFKERIYLLTIEERLNLLVSSFQKFDNEYNKSLCLNYTFLWREFSEEDWRTLILKMFPRKVKYEKGDLRPMNTGAYSDILLLNGIIGVSPFDFIFNEPTIKDDEKKAFKNYLKFYGEVNFFCNERELIEDIVNFYELDVFDYIVNMKQRLIENSTFRPSLRFPDLLNQYIK